MGTINTSKAVVTSWHELGADVPFRPRMAKRAGDISAISTQAWFGGYRLTHDSAPGLPPA